MYQNTAAHLIDNLPKFSHVTPLLYDLYWLPVAARIWFKAMVLVFKNVNGTAPVYRQTLVRPHAPVKHLALLHQLAGSYPHRREKTKPTQWSCSSSLFWHLSGGTNSLPMSGQWSHSPSSTKDSRPSPHPHMAWLPPNPLSKNLKNVYVTSMFISKYLCTHALKESLTNSSYDPQVRAWKLFLYFFLLHRWWYVVVSLVTNVLIVSHFGQKHLLNALKVNVNVNSTLMNTGTKEILGNQEKHRAPTREQNTIYLNWWAVFIY